MESGIRYICNDRLTLVITEVLVQILIKFPLEPE